jgi:hypothetical protein
MESERIDPKNRRSWKNDIKPELERLRPQLLGFIFDTIIKVLQTYDSGGIELQSVSRMADFEIACETISRCLGNEPGKFTEAYKENKSIGVSEVLEASPVARAVIKFTQEVDDWPGTYTLLLSALEDKALDLKINTTKDKLWPKSVNALSHRLKEIKTDLEEVGISIDITRDTRTRVNSINIQKRSLEPLDRSKTEESRSKKPENASDVASGDNMGSLDDRSKT